MAFCPNCGTQVSGAFCPNCGMQVGAGASVPPASQISARGLTENVASALCYLPLPVIGLVICIIFLVIAPYNQNKTVRFHAFQSIFAHIAIIILWIAISMLSGGIGLFLSPLFGLCVLALWLYLMYSAFTNRKVKLPIVGDLAEKQA
jgi:uncharacterized membrane protein